MTTFVLLSCLVMAVGVLGAPSEKYKHEYNPLRELPALRHEEAHDEFGQYAVRYITAENTVVSERGRLIPSINGTLVLEIEGQYRFISDDGKVYVTKYHAGADGFHVDGDHLPQQVAVPAI